MIRHVAWSHQNLGRVCDEVIAKLAEAALGADQVDWSTARDRVMDAPAPADEEAASSLLTQELLRPLGPHGFLIPPTRLARFDRQGQEEPESLPTGHLDPSGAAIVRLPGLWAFGASGTAGRPYSEALDAIIRELARETDRWLIDLTGNDGGNMHPMVAGLAGLLGQGRMCGFRFRSGRIGWVRCEGGEIRIGRAATATVPNPTSVRWARLALLVGVSTASSGEFTALSLIGRNRARVFGQPTAGLLTANDPQVLPSGWVLAATVATAVDCRRRDWPNLITPDIPCASEVNPAVLSWLAAEQD